MIKERRLRWLGLLGVRTIIWSNMHEGCEGHGTAKVLPQPLEWNWPKEAMNIPIGAGIVDGAKLF